VPADVCIRILFQILQRVLDFGKTATAPLSLRIIIFMSRQFAELHAGIYDEYACIIYIYIRTYVCCATVRREKRNYINGNPVVYLQWGLFSALGGEGNILLCM